MASRTEFQNRINEFAETSAVLVVNVQAYGFADKRVTLLEAGGTEVSV